MKYFLYALLGLFLVSAYSCDDDDPCEECQDAIDHMHSKIEDNSCNPDFMGNAVDRLEDDCGFSSGHVFAGYMAITCANTGVASRPECNSTDGDIFTSFLSVSGVEFEIRLINTQFADDTLDVSISNSSSDPSWYEMMAGDYEYPQRDGLSNGDEVEITIVDPNTDKVLLQKSETFRYWRPGKWTIIPRAEIVWVPLVETYDVNFIDW